MKQVFNPYLPLWEYVPDGEPHVFGERVYLYGSHDAFGGKKFCPNDYVCWSAPVTDLTDWRYEGVIYRKTQDPRMADGGHELWAPDVVQGRDGRYYLYYCPDDKIKSIGVAVCDSPAGQYVFYGLVKDTEGGVLGERPSDTIQFDPGVFIDDGEIYLYSGNGPRTKKEIGKEPKASVVMTLCDDMVTLKTEPKKLLPLLGESEGTGFEGHEFFEASSIRKIGGRYYLVYSSLTNHELCYAVSDRPDGDFRYGGVIVSNCDLFPGKEGKPLNCFGNNHGGLELINGKYYIFYHRETNRSICSRQGGAEEVTILPDGSIPQAELTSCGLNGGPLKAEGSFSAGIACNLYGKLTPTYSHPMAMMNRHPYITQDGPDFDPEKGGTPPRSYIANGKDGLVAGFKYFDLTDAEQITVRVRGSVRGRLFVRTDPKGEILAEIGLCPSKDWKAYTVSLAPCAGTHPLYLCYEGKGKLDILDFSF
ncbi:MAG: family 43 glycosylhydrolase [Oscillospiraceae bacterium]|nr:family 43 glycosylhydrolase [Oscillospiraceae bacterium]